MNHISDNMIERQNIGIFKLSAKSHEYKKVEVLLKNPYECQ